MAPDRRRIALVFAIAFVPALFSQQQGTEHYSQKQLRLMTKSAHTTEAHKRLADYYRQQERSFRAKEAEQRRALQDYNKVPQGSNSKYPTRGHSSRHLASYYSQQAEKAATLATAQEKLALKPTP